MGQGGMESLVEGGLNQEVVEDLEAAVKVDREVVVEWVGSGVATRDWKSESVTDGPNQPTYRCRF